jgi:hypothetical protein
VTRHRQYLQCRLVEPISSRLVASVRAYSVAGIFVLGGVRLITQRFAAYCTAPQIKSAEVVNQLLQTPVPPFDRASTVKP